MKKWLSYIVLAASLSACIYPYDIELDSSESSGVLVVDGEILTGGVSTIRLSYMNPLNPGAGYVYQSPQGKAWIEDETGRKYYPSSDIPQYNLITIPTLDAGLDHQYRAVIEVDGQVYSSNWQAPTPGPRITALYFDADETYVTVYVDMEADPENGSGYASFTFDETYEFHSDFPAMIFVNTRTWEYEASMEDYPFYWCFRSTSSHQRTLINYANIEGGSIKKYPLLTFPRTNSRNHRKYTINVHACSLNRETYLYEHQTQEQSQSGGDLFSPDPGALKGNLVCETDPEKPVLGMILVGDVTSKRAWLDNRYLIPVRPSDSMLFPVSQEEMPDYYAKGYRPIANIFLEDGQMVVGWGPERCINCILAGGTQDKPDFWED